MSELMKVMCGSGTATLAAETRPVPAASADQVLIKVSRAGVNFLDLGLTTAIADRARTPVPGIEVVGTDCSDGSRVVALCGTGGYAEYVAAQASSVFRVADGVSDEAALAVFVSGLTAWHLVHTIGRLSAGETIVVHSALGSVGALAVQLARRHGAGRVIGTASTPEKRSRALELGADAAVSSDADGLAQRLVDAARPRSIDLILERAGGPVFDESLVALGPLGRIVVYGTTSGVRMVPTGALIPKSQTLSGFLLDTVMTSQEKSQAELDELFALIAARKLDVSAVEVRPMSQAKVALADLIGRKTTGKLLLDPAL